MQFHKKCNISNVTLTSRNTPHRCLKLVLRSSSNMQSSNNFINTIVFCVVIFKFSIVTLITGHLQTTEQRNHGFLRPQDMSLTEKSYQVFLRAVREHGSFSYAIYKVIICNFV